MKQFKKKKINCEIQLTKKTKKLISEADDCLYNDYEHVEDVFVKPKKKRKHV